MYEKLHDVNYILSCLGNNFQNTNFFLCLKDYIKKKEFEYKVPFSFFLKKKKHSTFRFIFNKMWSLFSSNIYKYHCEVLFNVLH